MNAKANAVDTNVAVDGMNDGVEAAATRIMGNAPEVNWAEVHISTEEDAAAVKALIKKMDALLPAMTETLVESREQKEALVTAKTAGAFGAGTVLGVVGTLVAGYGMSRSAAKKEAAALEAAEAE